MPEKSYRNRIYIYINRTTPVTNATEALYTEMHIETLSIHGHCDQSKLFRLRTPIRTNLVMFSNRTDVHQFAHQRNQVSAVSVWSLLSIKSKFSLFKLSR